MQPIENKHPMVTLSKFARNSTKGGKKKAKGILHAPESISNIMSGLMANDSPRHLGIRWLEVQRNKGGTSEFEQSVISVFSPDKRATKTMTEGLWGFERGCGRSNPGQPSSH